jgi:dihydropteroate synthase
VYDFFSERIKACRSAGIIDTILDPGFGFGKNLEHNYTLLRNLSYFSNLRLPTLAGVSRKSMICKVLGVNPDKALNGTTAVNMLALMNGAQILRVHDVKEAKEVVKIFEAYKG